MKKITWSELRVLTSSQSTILTLEKYLAWEPLQKVDEEKLSFIGLLISDDPSIHVFNSEFPSPYNYWAKNYPIALRYYPYNGCEIYKNNETSYLYFVYLEFGGHVPEKRCRLVQKELIIDHV